MRMIEFNLILKTAGKPVIDGMFWRWLINTTIMLGFRFAGETGGINAWVGFVFGMVGWALVQEIAKRVHFNNFGPRQHR